MIAILIQSISLETNRKHIRILNQRRGSDIVSVGKKKKLTRVNSKACQKISLYIILFFSVI